MFHFIYNYVPTYVLYIYMSDCYLLNKITPKKLVVLLGLYREFDQNYVQVIRLRIRLLI